MNRPQPVITKGAVTGVIHSSVIVLGWLGLDQAKDLVSTQTDVIVSIALGLFTLGAHVLTAMHAAKEVTPLSSPVSRDGVPLVPITDKAPVYQTINAIPVGEGGGGSGYVSGVVTQMDLPDRPLPTAPDEGQEALDRAAALAG